MLKLLAFLVSHAIARDTRIEWTDTHTHTHTHTDQVLQPSLRRGRGLTEQAKLTVIAHNS